jgi:23S rRNA pseudouridine955/2504/2580 synthase
MSPVASKPRIVRGEVNHLRIDADQAGRRIDNLLVSMLGDVPKSHIYRMLRRGEVRLNGKRARPETRVDVDDILRVPPVHADAAPAATAATGRPAGHQGEFLLTRILYEDEDLLVIDKPPGMTVHAGTGQQYGLIETLRNARGPQETLELAHRLDRDTSGCLIVARSMRALRRLHDQFRSGEIDKRYLLLAQGRWKGPVRRIDVPLHKDRRAGGEAVVRVDDDGKTAATVFSLERQFDGCCLLSADLETGRTHQIRVHARHGGFPLAGDDKYGDRDFNGRMREFGLRRLFLHAAELRIPSADGATIRVEAPLPPDLQRVLDALAAAGERARPPARPHNRGKARR